MNELQTGMTHKALYDVAAQPIAATTYMFKGTEPVAISTQHDRNSQTRRAGNIQAEQFH